jgi:hypothetical protein
MPYTLPSRAIWRFIAIVAIVCAVTVGIAHGFAVPFHALAPHAQQIAGGCEGETWSPCAGGVVHAL